MARFPGAAGGLSVRPDVLDDSQAVMKERAEGAPHIARLQRFQESPSPHRERGHKWHDHFIEKWFF
jgi:hypothetical protein